MSTRHKLYDQEVNPPSGVWDRIAASLEDEAVGRKLYHTEATPPANNWNKIAAALDAEEAQRPAFAANLYNAEVQPPATAWQQIAASLDEAQPARVIPMQQRRTTFYRYLAAAVLAGVAVLAAWNWLGSSEEESAIASTDTISVKPLIEQTTKDTRTTPAPEMTDEQLLAATTGESLKPTRTRTGSTNGYSNALYTSNNTVTAQHPADRYIMLITPDGNVIRMSKKWGDMVCCVSGEEQDDACKDQLQRWQEKMAEAPVAPSPDNFMDILTLVNTLNETDL
jgi:hypothetical protein